MKGITTNMRAQDQGNGRLIVRREVASYVLRRRTTIHAPKLSRLACATSWRSFDDNHNTQSVWGKQ
jgi:hypothetical protein